MMKQPQCRTCDDPATVSSIYATGTPPGEPDRCVWCSKREMRSEVCLSHGYPNQAELSPLRVY